MNSRPFHLIVSLATLLGLIALSGCGGGDDASTTSAEADGGVLATTAMLGDAATALLEGTGVEVRTLADGQAPADETRLVIYHGLGVESGPVTVLADMDDALAAGELVPADRRIESAEGINPHVWMDVSLWAEFVVQGISNRLIEMYPAHADRIRANTQGYLGELARLDTYAREAMALVPEDRRVVPAEVEGLAYLANAYGLTTRDEADPIEAELFIDTPGPAGTFEASYLGMMDHNITLLARELGAPGINLHGTFGRLTVGHDHDHEEHHE